MKISLSHDILENLKVNNWQDAVDKVVKLIGEPKTLMEAFSILSLSAVILLYNKQKRYGKENILGNSMKEAHAGLYFRMRDKLMRIRNASIEDIDLGEDEPRFDSYGDEAGYGFIGMALERGWFILPLIDEAKTKRGNKKRKKQ